MRCPGGGRPNAAGAAYGSAAVRLVMFRCMFDESAALDGLNEQQRRAATHQGGPLLVLAGAGTGKTRTLVARAAWLRGSQGLPARRILDALAADPGSWEQAVETAPTRSRRALAATLARLADAAQQTAPRQAAAEQAAAVLALLDPLIRARYPDAVARLTDLQRLADAAAAQPSLHDALAACESVTAAPLAPVLPSAGSLTTQVDTALGALWDG